MGLRMMPNVGHGAQIKEVWPQGLTGNSIFDFSVILFDLDNLVAVRKGREGLEGFLTGGD